MRSVASITSFWLSLLLVSGMLLTQGPLFAQNGWVADGPAGGDIQVLLFDSGAGPSIYCATDGAGVFVSTDGGSNWAPAGTGTEGADVRDLARGDDTPRTLYAATDGDGVLVSIDGGATWSPRNNGLTDLRTRSLVVDPTDADTVYVSTAESGVFKSTNTGTSWSSAASGLPSTTIDDLAIDAQGRLLATALADGVFVSTNAGGNWSALGTGLEGSGVTRVVPDPIDPMRLWAGAPGDGVYRSIDSGATWQRLAVPDGNRFNDLSLDPSDPDRVYVATSAAGHIVRSTDGGETWSALGSAPSTAITRTVVVDPGSTNTLYAGTGFDAGIFKSTNGGGSWSARNTGLVNTTILDLASDPVTAGRLYAATEDGVFRSTDGGRSWGRRGLEGNTISALAIDPLAPSVLYAASDGPEDEGIYRSTNGGASWTLALAPGGGVLVGSVEALVLDPFAPNRIYAATSGGVLTSSDSGMSWVRDADTGLPSDFVVDLAIDPVDPEVLYASTVSIDPDTLALVGQVSKSTNRADSWIPAGTGLGQVVVLDLAIDPLNSTRMWAAAIDGGIFRSTDGGASWQPANGGLSSGGDAIALAVDPTVPDTLYASTRDGIARSQSGGTTWEILAEQPTGLVASLLIDPTDRRRLFGGTRATGVVRRDPETMCTPSASRLCIDDQAGDRRFAVTLAYDTALGGGLQGPAQTIPLDGLGIEDGGILWFFNQRNPEVLVKILDGCNSNGHFWIFYAATTTVGFTLSVEDMLTGTSRLYTNPDRTTAATITDTQGLATCDARRPPSHAEDTLGASPPSSSTPQVPTPPLGKGFTGACTPGPATLCIDDQNGDRRFAVTLTYDTVLGGGRQGDGQAIPLDGLGITDGGILWFFNQRNPEVLVKILDGCNSTGHFWVFYAATTTVGFTLQVTDTQTGETADYTNPDVTTAATVTDTQALAVCTG